MGIIYKIMAVQPLKRTKIIKKRKKHSNRFQSDMRSRVGTSWRKPRGVDCVVRRKFRGRVRMPTIGSKQAKRTRHLLPSGLKKLLIRNESDIELLLMHNRTYCGEIAQGISALKRKTIVLRAKEMGVRLTNGNAKLKKTSAE